MRIAIDAMGGDFAPQATVEGAYLYQKDTGKRNELVLVGQNDLLENHSKKFGSYQDYKISQLKTYNFHQIFIEIRL